MTRETTSETVTLTTEQVRERALLLSDRQYSTLMDQIELAQYVRVLTGDLHEFTLTDIWCAVLDAHGYSQEIPYPDTAEQWKLFGSSDWREETDAIFARLRCVANGDEVAEYDPNPAPSFEAGPDYFDELLRRGGEMVSAACERGCVGEDMLRSVFGYSALHILEHSYEQEWFDDAYALGYALLEKPVHGMSPFGGRVAQVALLETLSRVINESLAQYQDTKLADERRQKHGHTVAILWPLLKGFVMAANEQRNTPLASLEPDDDLIAQLEAALQAGLTLDDEVYDYLSLSTHDWSEAGTRVQERPTASVIEGLRARVIKEHDTRVNIPL